jgi:hypothetical protein
MTVAREKFEIQASGRRRVRFSISAASTQQPNCPIIGHYSRLRQNAARMAMRCHIPIRSLLCCLVITDHHCGRWCLARGFVLSRKSHRPTIALGLARPSLPKSKIRKNLPPLSGETLIALSEAREGQFLGMARLGHLPLRKWTMSNANRLVFALALGLSAAASAWQAMAQQTAQQSARDAAIHRCINQAHREFPGGESQDMQRSDAYKACMASLGFQP